MKIEGTKVLCGEAKKGVVVKTYYINTEALKKIKDTHTIKSYKKGIKRFCFWIKENDVFIPQTSDKRHLIQTIQRYTNYLFYEKGYTAATIHTYIAPVCKGLHINMNQISKPRRTSGKRIRSRSEEKNKQGKQEVFNLKYTRLVEFQKRVGIRRLELKRLKGNDLVNDESGYPCVRVRRGKGGKVQLQRIFDKDIEFIKNIFSEVGQDGKVFSDKEMRNHIDLHGMRADVAYKAYCYYNEKLKKEPEYKQQLINELSKRWLKYHPKASMHSSSYRCFINECNNPNPYKLRGENIYMAKKKEHPIEYNRLALMAVSVFHLSHWRLSVTVTNYCC